MEEDIRRLCEFIIKELPQYNGLEEFERKHPELFEEISMYEVYKYMSEHPEMREAYERTKSSRREIRREERREESKGKVSILLKAVRNGFKLNELPSLYPEIWGDSTYEEIYKFIQKYIRNDRNNLEAYRAAKAKGRTNRILKDKENNKELVGEIISLRNEGYSINEILVKLKNNFHSISGLREFINKYIKSDIEYCDLWREQDVIDGIIELKQKGYSIEEIFNIYNSKFEEKAELKKFVSENILHNPRRVRQWRKKPKVAARERKIQNKGDER